MQKVASHTGAVVVTECALIEDYLASVEDASRHMFDDAGDEFRSVRMIKQRFETWKAKYPKEYDEGYGALSMPGIFELFIRHELLHWKPLQVGWLSSPRVYAVSSYRQPSAPKETGTIGIDAVAPNPDGLRNRKLC